MRTVCLPRVFCLVLKERMAPGLGNASDTGLIAYLWANSLTAMNDYSFVFRTAVKISTCLIMYCED